jgi:predicted RNA-binding protein YlqC (UPF0109 family)
MSTRSVLENILTEIVQHPSQLQVTELAGEKSSVYELRCHPKDVGKVIGKSGKTVGAIRNLVGALAARDGKKAVLEIVE